jgi:hypothetical protein
MDINQHIQKDKKILDDPTTSPQQRRHIEGELKSLEKFHKDYPEVEKDPTALDLWCNDNPDALECKAYDV